MFKKIRNSILEMGKYKSAITLYEKGRYPQSIDLFREITQGDPSPHGLLSNLAHYYRAQAHYHLGRIFFLMGDYVDAIREFEQVLALKPEMNEVYGHLATCYYFSGETGKAMEAVGNRRTVSPSIISDQVRLASYFDRISLWREAAATLTRTGGANPDFADIHYNLGLAALGESEFLQALEHFEQALAINSHYRKTRILLGKTLAYIGNFDSAQSQLTHVLDRSPNFPDLYYYLGIIYSSRNDPDQAVESFGKALELNPSYTDARIKMAVILWGRGSLKEAREKLREGISINPRDLSMSGLLKYFDRITPVETAGLFPSHTSKLRETGMYRAMMGGWHRTIVVAPGFSEMLSLVRQVAGTDKGLDKKIIEVVRQPFKAYTKFPDYHYSIGSIYLGAKKYGEAEKSFRSALEIKPDYIEAHLLLFHSLRIMEEPEAALEAARFLMKRNISYPDFHYDLGKVYLSLKMKGRALKSFQTSLQIKPEGNQAEMMRDKLIKEHSG